MNYISNFKKVIYKPIKTHSNIKKFNTFSVEKNGECFYMVRRTM